MSKERYDRDFSNVEGMKKRTVPEELPEGPYGSPLEEKEGTQKKRAKSLKNE